MKKAFEIAIDVIKSGSAIDKLEELATFSNCYINDREPWKRMKEESNKDIVAEDIYSILELFITIM